jgi:hypothetical protein
MSKKTRTKEQEKVAQFAVRIVGAINEMIKDEEHPFYTSQEEMNEGNNLTHFFHALANVAPTKLMNGITGSDHTFIEFNHVANSLCFQYGKLVEK